MSRALYSAGSLNRLQQFGDGIKLVQYNTCSQDVKDLIEKQNPGVVIIDTTFGAEFDRWALDELMEVITGVRGRG